MKFTIDTEALSKNHITLGEFLCLLLGYYDYNFMETSQKLADKDIALPNLYKKGSLVLSSKSKKLINKILIESNENLLESGVKDFEALAKKLQEIYPQGRKSGTTYYWGGDLEEVILKMKALIAVHRFYYTEEEVIEATKKYVNSFGQDKSHMHLLPYFILKTTVNKQGHYTVESMLMTVIENSREDGKDSDNRP